MTISRHTAPDTPPAPPRIQLIAIGNELLNGETRETNLHWLTRFFTRKGGRIVRESIIPDDFTAVKAELEQAKKSGADLVVTTGGLGPTDDDATMAAIAYCIHSPLNTCEIALDMVQKRIDALAKYRPGIPTEMTDERRSMAFMPDGGEPLWNPVGVAPGMRMVVDGMVMIVLPGVPSEMKGIVKETLKGFWKVFFKGVCYIRKNIVLKGIPEAELAPFVRKVQELDPDVYIKTRLNVSGKLKPVNQTSSPDKLRWKIIVHFSVIECTVHQGRSRLEKLVEELVRELKAGYDYPLHIDLEPGRV